MIAALAETTVLLLSQLGDVTWSPMSVLAVLATVKGLLSGGALPAAGRADANSARFTFPTACPFLVTEGQGHDWLMD